MFRYVLQSVFVFALFAGISFISFSSSAAVAQPVIAVVNVQKMMTESKAAQSIEKQLEEARDQFQKEVAGREEDLREAEKKISSMFETLSAEELAKKRQEFQEKILASRKAIQERRAVLEEAQFNALQQLRRNITQVIAEISDEQDFDLVLTRQEVILAKEEMDITADAMKRLNKQVDDIRLVIDESK